MKAHTVNETINFERGIEPKDAMSIGDIPRRTLRKYYDVIASSGLFIMHPYKFPEFSFVSKEILSKKSKLCSNERHYGERAEFVLGYDDGTGYGEEHFFLEFENNGYVQSIDNLTQLRKFLTIDESYHFERGLEPKKAMDIGKEASDKKFIEDTEWELPNDLIHQNFTIVKLDRDTFPEHPIIVLKSKSDGDGDGKVYVAMSVDYRTDYYESADDALEACKVGIDMYRK